MTGYLLDTNICIFAMRDKYGVNERLTIAEGRLHLNNKNKWIYFVLSSICTTFVPKIEKNGYHGTTRRCI